MITCVQRGTYDSLESISCSASLIPLFICGSWGGAFEPQQNYSEPVERQHLSNFVRQTCMVTAVSKPLQSCLLSVHVEGTRSCRKLTETLLWRQKPLPFEPLNFFYSMVFATHRSLSYVKKCWTHYTSQRFIFCSRLSFCPHPPALS